MTKPLPPDIPRRRGKVPRATASLANRLREKLVVDHVTGCIEFTGYRDKKGYGRIGRGGAATGFKTREVILAHHAAWELVSGPVPVGMCLLHSCDNPSCCNVAHLSLGTRADNNKDMQQKGRASGCRLQGPAHHNAKTTAEIELLIRAAKGTQSALAAQFGLSRRVIARVRGAK